MELRIPSTYEPLPAQEAFHRSQAKFKGYGGAMGGGKSRALCEEAYQAAMDYPGIEIYLCRQEHTAIVLSTRKTMFREVLPSSLLKYCRIIRSGGFDYIEFPNGSVIHFVGLNDPVKFHSAEIGLLILDEAHQIDEDTLQTLNTRLRQKCGLCLEQKSENCTHLPRQILCGFNPENPGHWLYRYFILGSDRTKHGFYKPELRLDDGANSLGDTEFVEARAMDNPYLPPGYIERELGGMEEDKRRRYLEGEWLFLDGTCYFDTDSLTEYDRSSPAPLFRCDFVPKGIGDEATYPRNPEGRIRVYEEPRAGGAYAIGADVATGRGMDYSCAYVVDLHSMGLVAEFHGKLDADEFAEQLHFLGRWYQTALIAVESAGGYGEPVVISLRDGRHGRPAYPNLYRHVLSSRPDLPVSKPYGYPMNLKTRPLVLAQLQKAIRERSLPWMTHHLVSECLTFCEFQEGSPSPRARDGCNDDAVFAAAITLEMYRLKGRHPDRDARIAKRRKPRTRRTSYPWQKPRKEHVEFIYPK